MSNHNPGAASDAAYPHPIGDAYHLEQGDLTLTFASRSLLVRKS